MLNYGIEVVDLEKNYDHVLAVKNLNIKIPKGHLFVFLGPNGAGKTTTIKMLAGLLKPTKGKITIAGYDIERNLIEVKRHIGYIPDEPYLYEKLTGKEFLNFIGKIYQLNSVDIEERSERLLKTFNIDHQKDLLIETFSHGMKQKLIFCATLLHQPEVILIDEPMAGLDPKGAKKVKEILKELTYNGATIFLSTHTLSLAEEIADTIGIIHHGQLIATGTLQELLKKASDASDLENAFLAITLDE